MKTDHPAWGYRRAEDGSVESKLFPEGRPEGWVDSPARVPTAEPLDGERVVGEAEEGRKRRTSEQVDADKALIAAAEAADIPVPEGITVAELAALIAGN